MSMSRIQASIEEPLKKEGEKILNQLGMTTTELIRMTFRQLVMRKGLPFDVSVPHIPNSETIEAFKEAENPKNLSTYSNVEDAFSDMLKE